MTEKQFTVVGLGEVLWDVLPDGKHLGGAPANFAYISNALRNEGIVLSRVGNDEFGREIVDELNTKKLSSAHTQIDEEKPTGIVSVKLENGQPHYEIVENVAWDFLEFSADWRELSKNCDAVCFGSLAQRNDVSCRTIREFVAHTNANCLRIFDVNLRQKYFSDEILRESFKLANIVKLNHEELPLICKKFKIGGETQIETAKKLRKMFDLKLLCLTRGANGSLLVTENEHDENGGVKIEIADTIGAGDSFTAAMTHGILRGWNLSEINIFANKIGAFVASQKGAMPSFESLNLIET